MSKDSNEADSFEEWLNKQCFSYCYHHYAIDWNKIKEYMKDKVVVSREDLNVICLWADIGMSLSKYDTTVSRKILEKIQREALK